MKTVTCIYLAAREALGRYPAAAAALINIAVVVIGFFGFSVSGDQLVYFIAVVAAFVGAYVHARVTPLARK